MMISICQKDRENPFSQKSKSDWVKTQKKTPKKSKKDIKTYHSLTRQSLTSPFQSGYLGRMEEKKSDVNHQKI
jgi:hypothetical protein